MKKFRIKFYKKDQLGRPSWHLHEKFCSAPGKFSWCIRGIFYTAQEAKEAKQLLEDAA